MDGAIRTKRMFPAYTTAQLEAFVKAIKANETGSDAMTLHRWHELECGDVNNYASWSIVRGKKTGGVFEYDDNGKPYLERHIHTENKARYEPIADRERGALKRLTSIMANYPKLSAYVQTDPRGCALYIGEGLTDSDYSRGIAVYK